MTTGAPHLSSVRPAPRTARSVGAKLAAGVLCLATGGCASWETPATVDDASLRARAVSAVVHDVRLSAAVLSAEEGRRIFGADVHGTGVQPVWLEVDNRSRDTLMLLNASIDPDYFSPLEVAWSFHTPMASANNAALDAHFAALSFHNPIPPESTRAGIIFANPHLRTRLLNADLLGDRKMIPFSLLVPVPYDADHEGSEHRLARYVDAGAADYRDSAELRAALERLPCCATWGQGRQRGDPVNVVLVGTFADVATAVVRRGFRQARMTFDDTQVLFGRRADAVVRKSGQGGVPAQWMRLWVAPLRYRGQPVFLAQAGRPVGGRFSAANGGNLVLHPDVDEVRNLLIQDLLYSGGMAKLGFVSGVGAASVAQPRESLPGTTYHTDGARAVLFFAPRPLEPSDLEILDWIPLPERPAPEVGQGQTDARS